MVGKKKTRIQIENIMRNALVTLSQTAALFALVGTASADQYLSNLDQPLNWAFGAPDPETSYLQHFTSGPTFVQVQSVTIEQFGYDTNNPSAVLVELYRSGDSKFLGALPNFAPSSTPDVTTFLDYSPDAAIELAPNTEYVLVFSEPPSPFLTADLMFTDVPDFTALSGWNLGATSARLFSVVEELRSDHLKIQISGVPFTPNNPPPDITGAHASLSVLWPPNGKMIPLTIEGITDPDPNSVTITITGIEQNEAVANKPGDTSPDSWIGADRNFELKAERSPGSSGRVYAVSFLASNGKSEVDASGTVYVTVPGVDEAVDAASIVQPSKGSKSTKH
jgi:hypothetical protein